MRGNLFYGDDDDIVDDDDDDLSKESLWERRWGLDVFFKLMRGDLFYDDDDDY